VALVALAVAVPVVAGSMTTPGGTGTINFVNVNQYGPDWQSAPPINPKGPCGTFTYVASVQTTQCPEPQQYVQYTFSASKLSKGVEYALVNQFDLHDQEATQLDVHLLATGIANKAGILCLKGTATLDNLEEFQQLARTSGARLRLIPNPTVNMPLDEEHTDQDHGTVYVIDADLGVLFSVLGVPIILPENWVNP
jgi:hypothetical protein